MRRILSLGLVELVIVGIGPSVEIKPRKQQAVLRGLSREWGLDMAFLNS
jgi:hypothetical protein